MKDKSKIYTSAVFFSSLLSAPMIYDGYLEYSYLHDTNYESESPATNSKTTTFINDIEMLDSNNQPSKHTATFIKS